MYVNNFPNSFLNILYSSNSMRFQYVSETTRDTKNVSVFSNYFFKAGLNGEITSALLSFVFYCKGIFAASFDRALQLSYV